MVHIYDPRKDTEAESLSASGPGMGCLILFETIGRTAWDDLCAATGLSQDGQPPDCFALTATGIRAIRAGFIVGRASWIDPGNWQ